MNTNRGSSLPNRTKFTIKVDEEKKKPHKKTVTKQQKSAKLSLSNTENIKTTTGAVRKSSFSITKPRKALADLCLNTNLQTARSRANSETSVQRTTNQNEVSKITQALNSLSLNDKSIKQISGQDPNTNLQTSRSRANSGTSVQRTTKQNEMSKITQTLNSLSLNDKSIKQISCQDPASLSLYKAIKNQTRKLLSPCKLETITEISLPNNTDDLKASDTSVFIEEADISFSMNSINYEKLKQSDNITTTRGNYSDLKANISDVSFSILDDHNYERLKQCLNINMVRGNYTQYSSDEDDDFKSTKFFD